MEYEAFGCKSKTQVSVNVDDRETAAASNCDECCVSVKNTLVDVRAYEHLGT